MILVLRLRFAYWSARFLGWAAKRLMDLAEKATLTGRALLRWADR